MAQDLRSLRALANQLPSGASELSVGRAAADAVASEAENGKLSIAERLEVVHSGWHKS